MIIRTLFNPMRLSVDGVETPIIEETYLDEGGSTQKFSYAIVNGEKQVVERRWDLEDKIIENKTLDVALVKVEEARVKKVEDKLIQDTADAIASSLDTIIP